MPNWLKSNEYPPADSTTSAQWAWEFVRRNAEYRNDWAELSRRRAKIKAKYRREIADLDEKHRPEETEFACNKDDPLGTVYEPERLPRESESQWLERVGTGKRWPFCVWLAEKWGMRGDLSDPEKSTARPYWSNSHSIVREVFTQNARDPMYPAFAFDLAAPLKPQIVAVNRVLKAKQSALSKTVLSGAADRRRPGLEYQRHLRLLDALETMGLDDMERPNTAAIRKIGAGLFPKALNPKPQCPIDDKVRKLIPVARRLRDSGFAVIPSLPEQFKSSRSHRK